ncbi:superoxide dismutase [Cu-Zn] SodC [Brucella sp. 2716]|uniref:superoxide dismutase [Cu-Zn] SodC n=1 Tax=Brucella sp. 2716 TaxID=2975052 RepID=UPI00217F0ECE|nr:superoxide dismutase [Cu-Zn] SodC [Brucella sp. 2716]UWF60076.1 superoxide dismutase [Cu-Zn] SodC [Brucella sp. 2716]
MKSLFIASTMVLMAFPAFAESTTVKMYEALPTGPGKEVGTVVISEAPGGLHFKVKMEKLTPGYHGFHVHENPSCAPGEKDGKIVPALAAGGHYDPGNTHHHLGPEGHGHMGDLPRLSANADGKVSETVVAPHLKKLAEIKQRSLMIHVGGDNYSDKPEPLGGGGARFACGVIE